MLRAENRKYHYIYKITRFDGKYYIGMHSTDNLDDGYFGSGKLITRSLKKHGNEKHTKEILEFLPSRILMKSRERQLVNEEVVSDIKCMNLQLGGEGGFIDEIHQRKCAAAGGRVGGLIAGPIVSNMQSTKDNRLKTNLLRYGVGSKPTFGMLGKGHSEKARKQMSVSGTAEKNSQFGTCWVTNGVKPIKIKKEQLDEYLNRGYSRGRK